jgi:Fis family transcriptional regulator, factor for inversion stimulation protein
MTREDHRLETGRMSKHNLHDCVRASMEDLFPRPQRHRPAGLHDMLVKAVEKPLLEVVMEQAQNNQSRAAQWLGLNRNTLRKKLLEHNLLD